MTTEPHDHDSTDHKPTRSARSPGQSLLGKLLPNGLRTGTATGHLLARAGIAVAVVLAAVLAGTGGAVAAPVDPSNEDPDGPGVLSDDIQAEIVDTSEESITIELRFPSDVYTGDEQFPNGVFTGDEQFPNDVFTGDKQFPNDVFTGDEQFPTDRRLYSVPDVTIIFTGDEQFPTDVFTGDEQFPTDVFTGEDDVATPVRVEKVTDDDGISYYLTFRSEDVDLSATPGDNPLTAGNQDDGDTSIPGSNWDSNDATVLEG